MQYKVPQNIDQEDKILGPLTFVQFIYVLVGGGLILLAFSFLRSGPFFLVAIPIAVLTICFSLIKIQDQPFSRFFLAFLVYLKQPKRRVWHEDAIPAQAAAAQPAYRPPTTAPQEPTPVADDLIDTPVTLLPLPTKPPRQVPITVSKGNP